SPAFIIKTYHDWLPDLAQKNADNLTSSRTYVCVMGMISRIFSVDLSSLVVLIPAMLLFASSYLRTNYYQNLQYQLLILASCLIFTVIFSTGSEPPTYIIATIGGIWFMNLDSPLTGSELFLLIFALLLTNAPSDIFPKFLRDNYVIPYKLIALPSFIIWLKIIY